MAEMSSLWSYEENHDMEQLGQKLMCTTLELEKLKAEAVVEMSNNKEYVRQLIELLKYSIQERDEARNQFQKLLNKTIPTTETFPSFPLFQSNNRILKPTIANTSFTESNSLSESYSLHSHGSSLVDSIFDVVSSPDFFNINMVVNNQHIFQDSNAVVQHNHVNTLPKLDHASLIIDNLARTTILPQKGKFLQSVLQAGPLLQTLLLAGPLPRWRNPPQFQEFQIPPFSIKGSKGEFQNHKTLSCGSAQLHSAPMLSFGSSLSSDSLIRPVTNSNGYVPLNKRQRLC